MTMHMRPFALAAASVLMLAASPALPRQPLPGAPAAEPQPAPLAPQTPPSEQTQPKLTLQQLDELLGRVALYPDPLLAQLLPAATFPLEIVQAARWVREHPDLQGLDDLTLDPSVRAIAHYPTVIKQLDDKLDWTIQLGQAFLYQQQDVLDAVQRLRTAAKAVGSLRDTPQQQVVVEQEVIRIVPAQASIIYVPVYSPEYVYYRPAPGFYAGSFITFGAGFALGGWLDLDCDWRFHRVYYRSWRPEHFDRDPFHHGPDRPFVRPHDIARPGRDGDVWRRDPHREPPPAFRPRGASPFPPSDASRGRLSPASPSGSRADRPFGAAPGRDGPASKPGATPNAGKPVLPAGKPTPLTDYQRGTDAQRNSQRGQDSRNPPPARPAPPAAKPAAPPPQPSRPVQPTPSATQPRPSQGPASKPAPRPSPQPSPQARPSPALGGYQSGKNTNANSQRGAASRKGRGG